MTDENCKSPYLRDEYTARINRVLDYIDANIDKELTLEKLAEVAHFSRFHFHRIFSSMIGETLNHFIQRIRIEKAACQLIINRNKPITEIAFDCGFSGSAAFARAFRDVFNMSASDWRKKYQSDKSKIRKIESNIGQQFGNIRKEIAGSSMYITCDTKTQKWRIRMENKIEANVEVKEMPDIYVAYIRHIGPYKCDSQLFESLINRLFKWAGPRNLLNFPGTKVISVYHDDPRITDESKLRLSVCISVKEETEVDGEIGKMKIPGGKYAVARFELANNEYEDAWKAVYGGWLPESGYQPADSFPYELYLNDPKEHPEGKCIVEIHIPVKPL